MNFRTALHLPAPTFRRADDTASTTAVWLAPGCLDRADTTVDKPSPHEWLFWSFFMCMAFAALPFIGMRWTTPELALRNGAFADALMVALPVVLPLPFLFAGCIGALVLRPAARTSTAWATFGAAVSIGLAAVYAVLA